MPINAPGRQLLFYRVNVFPWCIGVKRCIRHHCVLKSHPGISRESEVLTRAVASFLVKLSCFAGVYGRLARFFGLKLLCRRERQRLHVHLNPTWCANGGFVGFGKESTTDC